MSRIVSGGGGDYVDYVRCSADENEIRIEYPEYEWVDRYPNCDGEYDRLNTVFVGYYSPIVLDLKTRKIKPYKDKKADSDEMT